MKWMLSWSAAIALLLGICAPLRAASAPDLNGILQQRGLLPASAAAQSQPAITPPDSVEVDERVQRDRNGQELARISSWDEPLVHDTLHIEVSSLPTRQRTVAYWVFPHRGDGCRMFGWTMYSENGGPLKSSYWRNDPGLKVTGGAQFPANLYPDTIPPEAFLRVLSQPKEGASGEIQQQISPYGLIGQNVHVEDTEQVKVPAGDFSALKLSTTPDVGSLMPSWPGFVLKVVGRFVPRSTYYFDANPPYRMIKQEGTLAAGGPEVTTELVRYYIAGQKAENTKR